MDSHIGYLIKSINDGIKTKADEDLQSHGLTFTQSRVLVFLMKRNGQATQKEIEDEMRVTHPTVVGIVSRMERDGFVTTNIDERYHRNKVVTLTKKAKETGRNMDRVVKKMEKELLSPLTEEQQKQLTKYLELIYVNLR
jgi:DNA-binding MarR family transcriptional regulator